MTLLDCTLDGLLIAAVSGALGALTGAVATRGEADFWKRRAEAQMRRLRAMRSDGREAPLFFPDRPDACDGAAQERPPGRPGRPSR